jgi:hypothetical protein
MKNAIITLSIESIVSTTVSTANSVSVRGDPVNVADIVVHLTVRG